MSKRTKNERIVIVTMLATVVLTVANLGVHNYAVNVLQIDLPARLIVLANIALFGAMFILSNSSKDVTARHKAK